MLSKLHMETFSLGFCMESNRWGAQSVSSKWLWLQHVGLEDALKMRQFHLVRWVSASCLCSKVRRCSKFPCNRLFWAEQVVKLIEFLEVSGGWIWIGFVGFVGMSHFFFRCSMVFSFFARPLSRSACAFYGRRDRHWLPRAGRVDRRFSASWQQPDPWCAMMCHWESLVELGALISWPLDVDALNDWKNGSGKSIEVWFLGDSWPFGDHEISGRGVSFRTDSWKALLLEHHFARCALDLNEVGWSGSRYSRYSSLATECYWNIGWKWMNTVEICWNLESDL